MDALLNPLMLVKKLSPDAHVPTQAHGGDAGWDLYNLEDVVFNPKSFTDVSTGIAVGMQSDNYFIRITGRSSTIRRWNLQVQEGIIDAGYTGELYIGVWNHTDHAIDIPKGTRLAQLIVHLNVRPRFVETINKLSSERGSKGFGSSGF